MANHPRLLYQAPSYDESNGKIFFVLWKCANDDCQRVIPVMYTDRGIFIRYVDGTPDASNWPVPIINLPSGRMDDQTTEGETKIIQTRFIKTFEQSQIAKMYGLDEIAGMGYRKAIEYLVKDWAINQNKSQAESINQMWLSKVIKDFYKGKLRDILDRATWLGNDHTHYNRLFQEYDISDLKELIALIAAILDQEYKLDHYITTIQAKKSPK